MAYYSLKEFLELYRNTFPNISMDNREIIKEYFNNYEYNTDKFFTIYNKDTILQGDSYSDIKSIMILGDGKVVGANLNGMVMSNTCDVENDGYILIAPVYDFEYLLKLDPKIKSTIYNIKKNLIYRYFYIPKCFGNSECVVDFSRICTYQKKYLYKKIQESTSKKLLSLTQLGYYLFILKLTIHLLRAESEIIDRDCLS
ncbi:MAG: hypothetical protein ACYDIA_23490 [Candidatus Humimicrobiaceae bacterium]